MNTQPGSRATPAVSERKPVSAPAGFWLRLLLSLIAQATVHVAASDLPATAAAARTAPDEVQTSTNNGSVIFSDYGTTGLLMNFRGAPLNLVLDYLSEAAGFVINKQDEVQGAVAIWSKQPVTKDEAVELLGSALRKSGYAITRHGRVLTIIGQSAAKTADTEIVMNNNPANVAKSDEVQTQIIPIRYATASQVLPNLEQLLPTSASLTLNESANTLILVATKTDIKRVLKIVDALDNSLASTAAIKVVSLHHANAKDIAAIISQLFAQQTTGQSGQGVMGVGPNFGGGPPGAGFGAFPGGSLQNTGSGTTSARGSVAGRVTAVADDRSNAVIISAPPDLLSAIEDMAGKLDQPVSDLTELRVFRLSNAEPSELADQLARLFPDDTSSNTSPSGNVPFFFPAGGLGGAGANVTSTASDRMKKTGKVLAVPDPRTSSLIVTAGRSLMPQIAHMIATLDADKGKREVVSYFELRNADPQDINQNLQDLFNRSVGMNNNNQNTFLGRGHPLTQRQTQNQQNSGTSTMSTGTGGSQSGTGARGGL